MHFMPIVLAFLVGLLSCGGQHPTAASEQVASNRQGIVNGCESAAEDFPATVALLERVGQTTLDARFRTECLVECLSQLVEEEGDISPSVADECRQACAQDMRPATHEGGGFVCTGTVVSPNVVVTAAHCVESNGSRGDVELYVSSELNVRDFGGTGQEPPNFDILGRGQHRAWRVDSVVAHERYVEAEALPPEGGGLSNDFDIALLFLESDIDFSQAQSVRCSPLIPSRHAAQIAENVLVAIAGYGDAVTTPESVDALGGLRRHALTFIEELHHAQIQVGGWVPDTHDGGTCFGDSGGPTYLCLGGKTTLVAVTSRDYGDEYARCSLGGAHTRVDYFLDWIGRQIADHPGASPVCPDEFADRCHGWDIERQRRDCSAHGASSSGERTGGDASDSGQSNDGGQTNQYHQTRADSGCDCATARGGEAPVPHWVLSLVLLLLCWRVMAWRPRRRGGAEGRSN
jgi:hypothetical protein